MAVSICEQRLFVHADDTQPLPPTTLRFKITQEDMVGRLARQGLQMNQSQIAKIESGTRPVTDFELAALAKALKVPVQVFFEA
jgi:hypothetical protein